MQYLHGHPVQEWVDHKRLPKMWSSEYQLFEYIELYFYFTILVALQARENIAWNKYN